MAIRTPTFIINNERDYIYFVLELKEDENLSFYYAGLALVRDTSNKFSYNGVCSALSDLKIIINNLSRKQNVTKEQQAFLDKWLPLIREAREKGGEEGVKDIVNIYITIRQNNWLI